MPRLLTLLLPLLATPAVAQTLPYEFTPDTPPARAAPSADLSLAAASAPAAPTNPFLRDETKADAEARAQAMFDRMDLDHDGFVTLAEMTAFAAAHARGNPAVTRAGPRKGRGTAPSSGKITAVPSFVKAMLDDADADHDGRISVAESKAAADRGFDETDTDHDGIVSPAERMAAMQDVTGNRPKRKADDMVGR